ncbi:37S ribosomal protein S35, mitochondrial [Leucoagaricus sp. SymC.cos]|nr:37S ribosomal protein S35, mitochondrial [Leucoagaricus sp. SymC.cos]
MLPLLYWTSRFPSTSRPCLRAHLSTSTPRSISASATRWSTSAPEPPTTEEEAELEAANPEPALGPDTELEGSNVEVRHERPSIPTTYKAFLSTIGARYKFAKPNNWLGEDAPFPMNPSFQPPPPLSDALRQQIYNEYMTDPVKNNIRVLSQRYHLSLKRIDAVLRLKGLEHSWYKEEQIQYGFQRGMEKLLGVRPYNGKQYQQEGPRWDATEADSLEQDENRDAQRQRYQRHYWESIPEDGREPIVPAALEHAKNLAQRLVKFEGRQKSTHPRLMPRFHDTEHIKTPPKFQTLQKKGRPTLEIQDIGGKFLDLNDRLKRIAVAERRSREKEKKREKRKTNIHAA